MRVAEKTHYGMADFLFRGLIIEAMNSCFAGFITGSLFFIYV